MATTSNMQTCLRCRKSKPHSAFPSTSSKFFPHRSYLCTECLSLIAPPDNWDAVDRLMQWLDLPFDLEKWTSLYKENGTSTLQAYLNALTTGERYQNLSWKAENDRWRAIQATNTLDTAIPDFSRAKMQQWVARWGDTYTAPQYAALDDLYDRICATQNVSTPILMEYAKDFCELTLRIKEKIRNGEDVKKEMDSRDNIVKVAGFEAKNAINATDFDNVGELINYYVKKGWQPNWAVEQRDVVDMTMANIQQYLRRVVVNEGGLAEQVEQRRESYNTALRLEEDQLTDGDLQKYEETDDNVQYEGENALKRALREYDGDAD